MKFTKVATEDKEKDKDGKGKAPKQKKCFNKICLRKALRISVLVIMIFLVVAVPLIVFNFLHRVEYTSLPADVDSMIIMSNCRLFIEDDASLDTSRANVKILAPGMPFLFIC